MFKTVDEAADVVTDIFIEKMADGFLEGLKGLGGKAMGGLRNAGSYMVNKGPNTLHSALGGNDAAHWGALGAIGLGGLGAAKGLVAPDEGKGRVRSMISNAALGALMGGAGGTAAGMTFPGVKNPSLGGGSIFSGDKEQHAKLQGNLDKTKADLDINTGRATLGPIGAVAASMGNAPRTGWGQALVTTGEEAVKPFQESIDNLGQSATASAGAQIARRAWQLRNMDKNLTTGDVKINPGKSLFDLYGNLTGTTMARTTIAPGTLADAANRAAAGAPAQAVTPSNFPPITPGKPVSTGSFPFNSNPTAPPTPTGGKHEIQKVVDELKSVIVGDSGSGGGSGGSGGGKSVPDYSSLPKNFGSRQFNEFQKTHGNTDAGRAAIQNAINQGKGYSFNSRVPLGGTWRGALGSQAAGQLIASQLRNLPDSVRRIRELDSSAWSRPEGLIGLGSGTPGEVQVAEQALQKFLAGQAARGGP